MSKVFKRMSWNELRNSGLLLFVNTFLHIFGITIAFEYDEKSKQDGEPKAVHPMRVSYRGFEREYVENAYRRISEYMKKESKNLYDEIKKGEKTR